MADLSKPGDASPAPGGLGFAIKKVFSWLLDWFAIQTLAVRLSVLLVAALIPATGIYSFTLLHQQAALAAEVKADRKSTRLNSSHLDLSRMPSSA